MDKLKQQFKNLTDDQRRKLLSAAEIVEKGDLAVVKKIIEFQDIIEDNTEVTRETLSKLEETISSAKTEVSSLKDEVYEAISEVKDGETPTEEELLALITPLIPAPQKGNDGKTPTKKELIALIEPLIPSVESLDTDSLKQEILEEIKLPEYEVYTLDEKGEQIVNEINALPLEDEYKIDASHIKNLPKSESKANGGGWRNLYQLHDVQLDTPTDGQVLTYDSTTNTWKNEASGGAGTIDGIGTTNELTYWVDSDTIGALAVATYPSLTEISYVKGVTSAIQTQLNAKQASDTQLTSLAALSYTGNGGKFIRVNAGETDFELATISGGGDALTSGGLTQFLGNNNWKVFYSDGSGDIQELALGANGTYLKSNGASSAPSFDTPAGGSGIVRSVNTISTPTTAGATASTDYVYFVTGTTTLTLPTAVGNTNRYTVKCVSGVTTIDGDGTETIDGSATITLAVESAVDLVSNGTEWKVL